MHINMKKEKKYIEYILKQAEALLAIDSPSGFTEKVTDYLCEEYKRLGYKPVKTKKGGVLVEIGGKGNAVLTMAHVDTLGGMVAEIKINGRLRLTKVGGLNANNIETENCRIYTLDGKVYEGTVHQHIKVFEEVGHGACASAPEDVEELLSVDMGCVGEGLECTDRQVSICVKDGHGPYHYDVVKGLIQAAKDNHIDYAADVYPYYGSDADAALSAGIDARHGLIGPGVYASHGYERSHKDAVAATLELLKAYLA